VYPVGDPPLKLTVPALFEKAGSAVHKLNTLPLLTETTESSFGLNVSVPSAALIGFPEVSTCTRTLKVLPVVNTPVEGLTAIVAAFVNTGKRVTIITKTK
jgi:hypothetical protein